MKGYNAKRLGGHQENWKKLNLNWCHSANWVAVMHLFDEFCDLQSFYFYKENCAVSRNAQITEISPLVVSKFKNSRFPRSSDKLLHDDITAENFVTLLPAAPTFIRLRSWKKEDDGRIWKTIRSTPGTGKQPPSKIRASFSGIQFHLMVVNNFWSNELSKSKAILSPTVEWNFKRLLSFFQCAPSTRVEI